MIRIGLNNCFCEYSSEPSGSKKDRHFIDRFNDYEVLKKKSFIELAGQLIL
jgi:hypothetical protein